MFHNNKIKSATNKKKTLTSDTYIHKPTNQPTSQPQIKNTKKYNHHHSPKKKKKTSQIS
jgi:hypothetical protein